jgi:two-component system, OmpR family, phosphate regulon sensor histidine kinase PhoR
VDAPAAVLVSLLGLLAGGAMLVALDRGRTIARLRQTLDVGPGGDVEAAARAAIAGRERAAWEVRRSQDELSHLVGLVGSGIVRLDDRMVVTLANVAGHTFLGRTPGGLVGLSAIEAFGDHRIESIARKAQDVGWASGEVSRTGGQTLVVRARRSPTEGYWLIIEDVSELRRLQRIRAEFIDNLSHELRTPLTNVRLLTETLARDLEGLDLPPRIRDGILKIDVESGHLVQMVNELLDLSAIEQGTVPLHLGEVDVGELIRASLERVRLFADRQGVPLESAVPADLAPARGDEERLGQLLVNLLHNAIKFSGPGAVVVVRAHQEEDTIVMSVEDHGVGIPRADLTRVFERFYKVDKARVRGKGGTGLGLAIVRHVAESHGGRAWVESQEGRGSTFFVALPSSRAV